MKEILKSALHVTALVFAALWASVMSHSGEYVIMIGLPVVVFAFSVLLLVVWEWLKGRFMALMVWFVDHR